MVCGTVPFKGHTIDELKLAIVKNDVVTPPEANLTKSVKHLIQSIL